MTQVLNPESVAADLLAEAPAAPVNPAAQPVAAAPSSERRPTIAPGALDRRGVPFDPARHIPKTHPFTGGWMPRGGRRPRTASPSSPSISAPPGRPVTGAPAEPSPSSPAASPAWSESERATTKPAPAPDPEKNGAPFAAVEIVDRSEDAAEVTCRAMETVAGFAWEAPDEWAMSNAERSNAVKALAAWLRAKGWTTTGGWSVLIMFAAWFLKNVGKKESAKRTQTWLERLKAWAGKKPPVTPAADSPAPASTAEAITQPAASSRPPGIPPLS